MPIISTGIGSGLDISGLVNQLVAAERAPTENRLNRREIALQTELSAIGSFKSSLSRFNDSLDSLKELSKFQQRTVSSSNEEIFKATVDDTAAPGLYEVEVVELARRHKLASTAYTDSETSIGTGTLEISIDGNSFSLDIQAADDGDTVESIRDAINAAEDNVGVIATIVEDELGSHLVISSKETGEVNEITINVTTDAGDTGSLSDLAFDPLSGTNPMTEKVEALDSKVIVDGFTQTSANLTVEGVIQGVTINLVDADPGNKHELNVELDKGSARDAVTTFVGAYNSLLKTVNQLTAYDPETKQSGPLQGDSTLINVVALLRQEMVKNIESVSGDLKSLLDVGVSTKFEDGTLKLDSDALTEAIDANFEKVGQLFANEDGYAANITTLLDPYLKFEGLLDNRTEGLKSSIEVISDQREALDLRMLSVQKRYQSQFNALDSLIGSLNTTGNFLNQQLANLPGFTYDKN